MNVASLQLCETLHELSGWMDTSWGHQFRDDRYIGVLTVKEMTEEGRVTYVPAYDLGYLLRKLPPHLAPGDGTVYRIEVLPQGFVYQDDKLKWCAAYGSQSMHHDVLYVTVADTPEDALCKLAIELFKQGILSPTKEGE